VADSRDYQLRFGWITGRAIVLGLASGRYSRISTPGFWWLIAGLRGTAAGGIGGEVSGIWTGPTKTFGWNRIIASSR
jgi:hypothetical protein